MWIDIFELPNGDIESVELYWDKKICYEATFANEIGIDEDGYVGDDDWEMGLGKHRIIEIEDKKTNKVLKDMFMLHIIKTDEKYFNSKICDTYTKEWLRGD